MLRAFLVSSLFAPAAFASSPNAVVLLQHRAEMVTKTNDNLLGKSAPLSEKGYQRVAAEKNDEEMKAFVHRVVEKEARYVKDVSELSGFVPFYSGVQLVQSLETMKKELRNAPWVVDGAGRNAALTEAGYQNVAKLRSRPHMVAFARRILDADFKKVADEGALNGVVPYFDGELSVQSYEQLKKELLSASWAVSRDGELDYLLASAVPEVSLSQQKPNETKAKQTTKPDERCDDWCSSDLFVKVEANITVLKNLSSWAMKCGWAHCGQCSACSEPSVLMAIYDQYQHDASLHMHGKSASCQDWCSSEVFQAVKQNVSSAKQFAWEMKCEWQNCGGCSKCSAHPDVVKMHSTASVSAVKSFEDPVEEEPIETTLATTTTAATTTVVTTTLATTTLATTTLATTTLATTTLATTTILTTVVTTTLPTTTLPEEEEEEEAE